MIPPDCPPHYFALLLHRNVAEQVEHTGGHRSFENRSPVLQGSDGVNFAVGMSLLSDALVPHATKLPHPFGRLNGTVSNIPDAENNRRYPRVAFCMARALAW